ncbi:MAG TPA: hypothetical protein VLA34_14810, partial [Candidatus Krumholzibacterium sp.]|nr:hypothetical protein [Candidatus Krumholzibacterium sp.]
MMHSRVFIAFVIVLLALIVSGVSSEDRITRQFPLRVSQDGAPERRLPERRLAASAAQPLSNAVLLREYDFDNMGSPDPQGWTGEDVLALQDTFFHVDDFSGLGPEYTPISGSRSLWCGTADTTRFCSWVKLPGYGNYWDQYFESRAFDVSGDVNLVFDMRYDCEAGFDSFFVEFKDKYDQWQVWAGYSGTGAETFNDTLSADTIGVTVSFRFHFVSDFGYSDEDYTYLDTNGAVIIDNIAIRDGTGLVDAHNFEGEALGATSTGDGDWWGHVEPGFGDYTGLFDGSTVLQEDPLRTNTTHLWGFFNGSPDTYDCGGHPEQLAVPMRTGDGDREKVYNRIYSPWISLAEDIHGSPLAFAPGLVVLEFDAYMDLPLIRDVFLQFDIRYMVDGCENLWQNNYVVYRWDASPRWLCYRFLWNVVPGATDVQVAVKVRDMAPWAGSEDCHSHAPLIDDVSVYVLENSDFIVTTVSDSGVGTLRQAILNANASPGTDVIEFAFSPTASHITFAPQTPLPAITDPVIIDGYSHVSSSPNTRPQGEAGNAVITINLSGVNLSGGPANHGLTLAADNCTIRGLAINGF